MFSDNFTNGVVFVAYSFLIIFLIKCFIDDLISYIRKRKMMKYYFKRIQPKECSFWRNTDNELPANDNLVLAVVSGKIHNRISLVNSIELMHYCEEYGWESDNYLFVKDLKVNYWAPIPELPKEVTK